MGMPRYAAPDEVAHTIKAYGTAHGETIGERVPGISPLTRLMESPLDLADAAQACFAFHPEIPASCAIAVADPRIGAVQTSAATYPPAYYLVVGGLTRVTGVDHSLRAYRTVSVLMVVLMLTAAAFLLRRLGRGRPALLFLALTPMAIFMSAAVNPTSIEIAGTVMLWTYLAVLAMTPDVATRRQLLIASTIAAAIVLVRPVALPWVAVAIGSFFVIERRPLAASRKAVARTVGVASVPLAGALVASAAWSRYAGVGLTDDKYLDTSATIEVFRAGLGRTSVLYEQSIGILGWLDTSVPYPAIALTVAGMLTTMGVVMLFGDRRTRLLLVAFVAIWVLYPTVYVTVAKTPSVWQGRYNLPLLGGLLFCALWCARDHVVSILLGRLTTFLAAAFVAIEVSSFHQMLRRFMVGAKGDILLRDPAWYPSITAWVLIAANLAAAVGLAMLLCRSPVVGSSEQQISAQSSR